MRLHPRTTGLRCLRLLRRRRPSPPKTPTLVKRRALTRASSPLPPRGAIAAASTFAMSCNSRASRKPSDPHHLRYMQPRALGRKASDEFTVPLSGGHHRAAHRAGDERAWWKAAGIDPMKFARRLWKQTRVREGRLPADEIMQTSQSGLALNFQPIGSTGRDVG